MEMQIIKKDLDCIILECTLKIIPRAIRRTIKSIKFVPSEFILEMSKTKQGLVTMEVMVKHQLLQWFYISEKDNDISKTLYGY